MSARDDGLRELRAGFPALANEMLRDDDTPATTDGFGDELYELALSSVFGGLWSRPGLDRRSRRLVTLGILITLGATDELAIHLRAAHEDGISRDELAEIIYHAAGYAGFPQAARARAVGQAILDDTS